MIYNKTHTLVVVDDCELDQTCQELLGTDLCTAAELEAC